MGVKSRLIGRFLGIFLLLFCTTAVGCSSANTGNDLNAATDDETAMSAVSNGIDSRFVGTWIGYDMYTLATVDNPEKLSDYGLEMTLYVYSDGTGSLVDNFSGAQEALSVLSFKPGISGSGYQVYDKNGEGVGALEWGAKNNTTEWVVLVIPSDELVCYSFYKN